MAINPDNDYDDEDEDLDEKPSRQASAPVVDAEQFAASLIRQMNQTQNRQADDDDRDEVLETINLLKSEGYSDDYIRAQILSLNAMERKMERNYSKAQNQRDGQNAQDRIISNARNTINHSLRQAYKDIPDLKDVDASIRKEIDDRLADNSKFSRALERNILNEDVLEEVIEAATAKFIKKFGLAGETGSRRERKDVEIGKGASSSSRSDAGKKQDKPFSGKIDVDALEEHQRKAYFAATLSNERWGGMDKAEAKRDAYEYALKVPKYVAKKSVRDA